MYYDYILENQIEIDEIIKIVESKDNNNYLINHSFYLKFLKELYKHKDNPLLVYEIDKHSPLKIILGGSFGALIGALILAGGKADLDVSKSHIKANIVINKSLGEALRDLQFYREHK